LKDAVFVYGPFSWEDRTQFSISMDTWKECLPVILSRETKQGTLFWKGFSDSFLVEVSCTNEEISWNKTGKPTLDHGHVLPVLYDDRVVEQKKKINRCTRHKDQERSSYSKYFWVSAGVDENMLPRKEKVAAWIKLVKNRTASAKNTSSAKKKYSTKKGVFRKKGKKGNVKMITHCGGESPC